MEIHLESPLDKYKFSIFFVAKNPFIPLFHSTHLPLDIISLRYNIAAEKSSDAHVQIASEQFFNSNHNSVPMVDKSISEQSRRQNQLDFPEHQLFPWIDRRQVNGRELYNLKAWNSQSKQKEEGRLDLLCSGTETPQLFCFKKMENTERSVYKVSRFYSFLRSHCTVVKRMQVATLSRGTSFLRRNSNVICGTGFPLNAFLRWQKRNRKQRHRVSLGHDSASRNLAEICCFVESRGKGSAL